MESNATIYRIVVRSKTGDERVLTSWESTEHPLAIVINEYGTIVQAESENGPYRINGVQYEEVRRTLHDQS
jgi:hypothetical protein